jgi:hypothetical protein
MPTIEEFKNINPQSYGTGRVTLFVSGVGPYTIKAMSFPIVDSNPGNFRAVLQQVDRLRFNFTGATKEVTVLDRQIQQGTGGLSDYMYFEFTPINSNTLPSEVASVPTEEDSRFNFIPYFSFNFLTNDFNILLNNSERSKLSVSRRKVDRVSSQANPSNLNSIISQSATFAEAQECNYSKRSVINARYLGTKLTSGSVKFDDPALTFISFNASIHGRSVSYDKITSIPLDQREITALYFNPVFPGDLKSIPTEGRPIYREEKNRFVRLENIKFFIPDANIVGEITSGSATNVATYSTNTIPPQTYITGSALSGSVTHYTYIVSNYAQNNVAFVQWISGSTSDSTNIPADSEIIICASKILSNSGVVISKGSICS